MVTKNSSLQVFPTGEIREFEGAPGEPMLLVSHTRAPGDPSTDNLTGTAMEDMPPPFEPSAE